MGRTPDGSGTLELVKFHAPADPERPSPPPPNRLGFRQVALEVNNLDTVLDGLRDSGFDTVGAVLEYGGTYRVCYVRGPEGLIIELAERVAGERAP